MEIRELITEHIKYPLMSWAGKTLCGTSLQLATPDHQLFDIPHRMNPIDRIAIRIGSYERDEIRIFKKWLRPDDTIIEIGANIGVVARYAFREKLKDGGSYICVEPNPELHVALHSNMRRARTLCPKKNFILITAAVCEPGREGKNADFFVRPNLSSGLVGQVKPDGPETVIQVPTRSLGSIIREHASRGASLICDAEGAEIPMIFKDPEAFADIRQIAIELHEPGLTGHAEKPATMISRLNELGFAVDGRIGSCYYLRKHTL